MNGNLAVYSSRQKGTLLSAPSIYICQWQSTSQCDYSATWTAIPSSQLHCSVHCIRKTNRRKISERGGNPKHRYICLKSCSHGKFCRNLHKFSSYAARMPFPAGQGRPEKLKRYGNVWSWKVMVK